jgi:uncharacterized protein with PIN domain
MTMAALVVDTSAILATLDEAYIEHGTVATALASEAGSLVVSSMVVRNSDPAFSVGRTRRKRISDDRFCSAAPSEFGLSAHITRSLRTNPDKHIVIMTEASEKSR